MIRTQILLEPQLKKELWRQSCFQRKSNSQLIREIVKDYLLRAKSKQTGLGALLKLSKMGIKAGPKNLSGKVDEILYK